MLADIIFLVLDLPSVVSGNGVGFLDPHEQFFKARVPGQRALKETSSYLWDLREDRAEIASLQHQFDPFKQDIFGFTEETMRDGFFKGTMLRFPFRNKGMESDLSKTLYDQSKIKSLVTSMEADAHNILLFLKNLESIEFYEKKSGITTKLLDIRIAEPYQSGVKQQRQHFQQQIANQFKNWMKTNSISAIYPISIEVTKLNDSQNKSTTRWFISQYFAGKGEANLNKCSSNTGNLPAVGVALQIPSSADEQLLKSEPRGHIFCFLPLPLEKRSPTGLHFHVHGCFAVDQNRRHIKWPSADQKQLRDDALLWNQFLVNAVLPKAMLRLTAYLITNFSEGMTSLPEDLRNLMRRCNSENPEFSSQCVYSLMPDKEIVTYQWQNMVENFYQDVWNLKICYTPVLGGKWLQYSECIFADVGKSELQLVRSILLADKQNLSSLPVHLFTRLPYYSKKITAEGVCESLKKVQNKMEWNDHARMYLLTYLLDGLQNPTGLIGLKLLPLANQSWTEFKPYKSNEKIYVESYDHPRALLPGLEHLFLYATVPGKCKDLASKGGLQELFNS